MSDLVWTDSLSAPRSLATRGETGVAIIEDPGVMDLCLTKFGKRTLDRCAKILGADLPMTPWTTAVARDVKIVWTGQNRWRVVGERDRVRDLFLAFQGKKADGAAAFDLTGAYACFRIVGATAHEILMRICPLDLRPVEPDMARGTSFCGVSVLLIREAENSWMALAPRSFAEHVAGALVEAARTPGRLALFEPAHPPPV